MGSIVEYHCSACRFRSARLSIGWGKAGRGTFWGGLARCEPCQQIAVVDLSKKLAGYDDRQCEECGAGLTLIEGTSTSVACPRCRVPMAHATVGTWA